MHKGLMASSASLLVLALSACGGGGGGSGARPQPIANVAPPPAPTTAPAPAPTRSPTPGPYDTTEYRNSNSAVAGQALAAYNKGATGLGVKLAVIDSGINPALTEFAGRIDPASRDVTTSGRSLSDEDGHGSAVAAVAAAAKDNSYVHGVAFDATVIALRADTAGSCATDDGCKFNDSAIATGVRAATDAGARVINMSLGGSQPGSTLLSAINYAVSRGAVIVISAGNDGREPEGVTADPFAATPAAQFPGSVIVAGSIGTFDGESRTTHSLDLISPFSNRAGSSANNYLAALGAGVKTIDHTGGRFFYSGTSFSAPTITGAVALLAHAFPNLTGPQIVDILFKSADDLGAAGTDSVYGRGRLNLAKAFQPIGTTTLAGSSTPVTGSGSTAPPASGDAGTTGGPLGAVVLDGYSRAFTVNLAQGLQRAAQEQPLAASLGAGQVKAAGSSAGPVSIALTVRNRPELRQGYALERTGIGPEDLRSSRLLAGSMVAKIDGRTAMALGFSEGAKAMERRLSGVGSGGFLIAKDVAGEPGFAVDRGTSLAVRRDLGAGVNLTLSGEKGEVWQGLRADRRADPAGYNWTSLAVDRRFGRTGVTLGLGRLDERRTVLGGEFVDTLGGAGGARSSFLDLEARHDFGAGVTGALTARRGWTDFAGGRFTSAAYGVDLGKQGLFDAGDRLALRLSQPLRITGGGFDLSVPTGYDYATGAVTYGRSQLSLSPSGREVDAELSYSRGVLGSGWIGGNLFLRRQPGHVATAAPDYGAAVRFTLGF